MNKIKLNNGKYKKINKKKLEQNIHCLSLLTKQYQKFYNISIKDLPFTRFVDNLPKIKYYSLNLPIDFKKSTRHYISKI